MRVRSTIAVAALILTVASGCSGSSDKGAATKDKTATTSPSGLTTTAPSKPVSTKDVDISGFAFSPQVITVKAGTTVTWTNKDSATHTVTDDKGDYDLGKIAPGDQHGQIFKTPGTYHYHCEIHSSMTGTIIVT